MPKPWRKWLGGEYQGNRLSIYDDRLSNDEMGVTIYAL